MWYILSSRPQISTVRMLWNSLNIKTKEGGQLTSYLITQVLFKFSIQLGPKVQPSLFALNFPTQLRRQEGRQGGV